MSIQDVLDSAHRNLARFHTPSQRRQSVGVLFVADPEGVQGYERLAGFCDSGGAERRLDWAVSNTDSRSITLQHSSGFSIIAVRGQQLITREGLEVLGIGHSRRLKSGETLAKIVQQVRGSGGRPILAWGVGKWLGRRGRLISELIVSEGGRSGITLVDNGGRPWCWSRVSQFDIAKERGIRILAGSDPLPLRREENRIGSFCYSHGLKCKSGESILDAFDRVLDSSDEVGQIVGNQMRIFSFLSNQLRLRLVAVRS